MKIFNVNYVNFRNLIDDCIELSNKINVFYGKNAQGKTSILEAIYFNCTGISFRAKKNSEIIKKSINISEKLLTFGTHLDFVDNIGTKNLTVSLKQGKKEFKYNGNLLSHNEFYGKLNAIAYIPEDLILINGSPASRRMFFDVEISQSNEEYFNNLKKFNKLLKIRNKYLKEKNFKNEEFSVYQAEFIKYGALITKKRADYIKKLSIILNLNYRKLFNNKDELTLKYISSFDNVNKLSAEKIEEIFREQLEKVFYKEKRYGFSLVGPHKDDYLFTLNSFEAKTTSSQGEKKSIIFSLKLSEIEMIFIEKKEYPILLIDDMTSYFDEFRRNKVLDFLKNKDIQVFISSTDKLEVEAKNFYIEKGEVFEK